MKKSLKIPTLIGLIVLVIGLATGLFLINKTQLFKISANIEAVPKNIRVSNITDSNVTVTWTTDVLSNGLVKWGESTSSLSKIASDVTDEKNFVHSATITGIEPNSSLNFKINSNGKDYDNNGVTWQSKTLSAPITSATTNLASGLILSVDGTTPAKTLIYLTINGVLVSGITSNEGSYVIPVTKYVSNIDPSIVTEISVTDGNQSTSQAVIYAEYLKSVPTIVIGKTYDFRTLSKKDVLPQPESSLTVPETILKSSRFEVSRSGIAPDSSIVNIDSIKEGEIINTTDPEFFGKAPKSSKLEIQVESELQTGTVVAGKNGDWKWSPPNDLEPGEHKVTLKWTDAAGILRTLTRTFIVQAAEGPAFESTPSATPLVTTAPTAAATTVPTITPETTVTPISTIAPTPETGNLTPTIGLFIMGIGILSSSFFVYKKSNA